MASNVDSKQILQHDKRARKRECEAGQRVMVRNYRSGPDWIPGTVTKALGPLTFLVCVENGQVWKRHIDQIKLLRASGNGQTRHRVQRNFRHWIV